MINCHLIKFFFLHIYQVNAFFLIIQSFLSKQKLMNRLSLFFYENLQHLYYWKLNSSNFIKKQFFLILVPKYSFI